MVPYSSLPLKYGSCTSVYFSNLQNEKINVVPDDVTKRHISSFECSEHIKDQIWALQKDLHYCEINNCKELWYFNQTILPTDYSGEL